MVGLDQATKAWIVAAIGPGSGERELALVGSTLRFVYVENRGAAFGLWQGQGLTLTLLAVAVLIGLVWYVARAEERTGWLTAGLGLIAGGALGNLADRIRLGYVVDFVAVGWWPRFNLADCAITLGVVCLLLHALHGTGQAEGANLVEKPVSSGTRAPARPGRSVAER